MFIPMKFGMFEDLKRLKISLKIAIRDGFVKEVSTVRNVESITAYYYILMPVHVAFKPLSIPSSNVHL